MTDPNTQADELLPCPFCRGNAGHKIIGDGMHKCVVECGSCHVKTDLYWKPEYAAKAWNTRAPVTEQASELDAAIKHVSNWESSDSHPLKELLQAARNWQAHIKQPEPIKGEALDVSSLTGTKALETIQEMKRCYQSGGMAWGVALSYQSICVIEDALVKRISTPAPDVMKSVRELRKETVFSSYEVGVNHTVDSVLRLLEEAGVK